MSYDDFIDYRFTLLLLTILFQKKDNRTQKKKKSAELSEFEIFSYAPPLQRKTPSPTLNDAPKQV
ncbi:hypothetical protein BsIDN1_68810 [Bacillus safensis]|uniref:Uncharacterized protein n=1 Tax=Bacillus safensis TaxID=561879 RepID=A0A5S9MJK9_BACIA|nr:hypothetical protein BsIDN1_68810 [Bacillus safensis]